MRMETRRKVNNDLRAFVAHKQFRNLTLAALILPAALSAFPLGGRCSSVLQSPPIVQTVDGVPFVECTLGINNFSEVLAIDFGAQVSDYSLDVTMPGQSSSITLGDVRVLPSWGAVSNAQVNCAVLFGNCISRTFDYTVAGHWDHGGTGTQILDLEIDLQNGLTWGQVGYPKIEFTSLTDPPADAPEPTTILLIAPTLAALILSRRRSFQSRNRPA